MNTDKTGQHSAINHTSRFKVFHDLMRKKVGRVLLISTSYEAWIMEEDCRLSEHIVHEYKGLNLSRPPRLTWVSTTEQALECLHSSDFDLVIIISRAADAGACSIAEDIKRKTPAMPVILLTHQESLPDVTSLSGNRFACIDRTIFWTGNASLLVAIIKSVEDQLNVVHDTRCAGIRIILLVEDSPFYLATLLLASSEPHNADLAADIPACFIDKNASALNGKIRSFLMDYLGFGDFIFRLPDENIARRFTEAAFPETIRTQLAALLEHIRCPIAVRSSSLLEDAPFKSYAGLYKTYLLTNDHEDVDCRLAQLIDAVKMVYASTYFEAPRRFARRVGNRVENEKMAVIVQRLVGRCHGTHFYPSISGIAQSENYYPFSRMKTEDGIASIALGLGKTVMEGGKNLRFSPRFPKIQPQRSTVEDILENSQTRFYALKMGAATCPLGIDDAATLSIRDIADAVDEVPVRMLASSYIPHEHRIRDAFIPDGHPVLTFASVLKYDTLPLPDILGRLLSFGRKEMGSPVEIEFAVDLPESTTEKARLAVRQIRPMSAREEMMTVDVTASDRAHAFCISHRALGNTIHTGMVDIVYVKPNRFDPACTLGIAKQIAQINARLVKANRKYVLIGPGRWGSADRWLGIPVGWADISGVGAIVETVHPLIHADPSQGSHFFHNITTLGISYLNVGDGHDDRMDWQWLATLPVVDEKTHVVHTAGPEPFKLKVDGRTGVGVVLPHHACIPGGE